MLDQDDRLELATFFARRLTPELKPIDQDDAVDVDGWVTRLQEPSLRPLAEQIRATCPEDANLQAACHLLESMEKPSMARPMWFGLAGVAAAALLFVGMGNQDVATQSAPLPAAMVQADLQPNAKPVPLERVREAAKSVANVGEAKLQADPAASVNDDTPVKVVARTTVPPARAPAKVKTVQTSAVGTDRAKLATPVEAAEPELRCGELPEGAVGYWYAGVDSPGTEGDTLTIAEWTNVREELPTYKNEWSTRTPVQCILRPGDKLTLSKEPSFVPRDSYWVAIVATDVVEAG